MVKDCGDEKCHHAAQYATLLTPYGIRFTALTSNSANNTLSGMAGNDTLTSGITNDEIWRKAA